MGSPLKVTDFEALSENERYAWNAAGEEVAKEVILVNPSPPAMEACDPVLPKPDPNNPISKGIEKALQTKRGWGWPMLSKKAHFFFDGRSLCGKWMFTGEMEDNNHDSVDNCAICKKKHKQIYGDKK